MLLGRKPALLLLLALVVLPPGCGSNGGEGTVPAGTLSKAQFLKQATAICAQGTKEAQKLDDAAWEKYEPDRSTTNEAVLNKVSLALLPAREEELRRLRALGLPKGDEQLVDRMLTATEEGYEEGKEDPTVLRDWPPDFGFSRAYEIGAKYGLEGCW
jgi:hypothetical protein